MKNMIRILIAGVFVSGTLSAQTNETINVPIVSDHVDVKKSTSTYPATNTTIKSYGVYPKGGSIGVYGGSTSRPSTPSTPGGDTTYGGGISVQFD